MPILDLAPRLKLYYRDENQTGHPTVLLLHGLGVNSSSWQLQFPALVGAGLRVLAPDIPGFGRSTYPGGGTSVETMVASMVSLLQILHTTPAHVVGISMGGALALQLALDYPQHVGKLVLVNTFAHFQSNTPDVWLYFALRFLLVHLLGLPTQARLVAKRIFPKPEQRELRQIFINQVVQADPKGYRAAMRALARFNIQARLGEVRSSTLVVTGDSDNTVPPNIQHTLVDGIPGARQEIISKAGHAVIIDQPEIFNQIALCFLHSSFGPQIYNGTKSKVYGGRNARSN